MPRLGKRRSDAVRNNQSILLIPSIYNASSWYLAPSSLVSRSGTFSMINQSRGNVCSHPQQL